MKKLNKISMNSSRNTMQVYCFCNVTPRCYCGIISNSAAARNELLSLNEDARNNDYRSDK